MQNFDDIVFYVFYKVFISLLHLHAEIVNLSTKNDALYSQITGNIKYFPYFQNCLGTLDGIYILAYVSAAKSAIYWNWKRILLQNVLKVYIIDI